MKGLKIFTHADLRRIEYEINSGKITYNRAVEIFNDMANAITNNYFDEAITSEQKRYIQELAWWRKQYHPANKPEEMSLNEWTFEAGMSKPNKPGYYRANND